MRHVEAHQRVGELAVRADERIAIADTSAIARIDRSDGTY
jgi:hypothetical protein